MALLGAHYVLNAIAELYQGCFFQRNRVDLAGKALFWRTLVFCLCFVATLVLLQSIVLALLALLGSNAACTWYWAIKAKPYKGMTQADNNVPQQVRNLLKEAAPVFASTFLVLFIFSASRLGIAFVSSDSMQAYFNIILLPAQVLSQCSQFIFKPLLNDYGRLHMQGETQLLMRKLWAHSMIVVGGTLALMLVAWPLGAPALGWVYGVDMNGYMPPLLIMIAGGGTYALSQLFFFVCITVRQQRLIFAPSALVAVGSLPLALAMIPFIGIYGAAWAFLLAHLALAAALGLRLRRQLVALQATNSV
jgi:O-antigen/teichoic acid export membrane protein